ncbi:CPBP family intramembrane glutamic endopeptidase [Nocardia acidivorans]|uniref:CPBP family intramembrane glutamic endopeptidase n=1 Tax=Nocardia acidivorans TaxID=404580 RepID=UPI000A940C36|nr:CPBP family intramembrane glutamic endopeptidase [Nocardia acidivorans]
MATPWVRVLSLLTTVVVFQCNWAVKKNNRLDRTVVANKRGVVAFVLISFGVAWLWLLLAVVMLGYSATNPAVQLPFALAPGAAAVIVRRWITREGFGDAGLRPRVRRNWRWYLVAWLAPLGLAAATVAVAVVTGLWRPGSAAPGSDSSPSLLAEIPILLVVVVVLTPLYWGEEFGWTSYLRPRVYPDRPLNSVLVTGLVWAIWHYPLAFLGYINFSNVALGLAIWTFSFLSQETILAWLYIHSRSIWTASLAHAGNNMVLSLLAGQLLATKLGDMVLIAVIALPLSGVATWIVLTGRLRPGALHPVDESEDQRQIA